MSYIALCPGARGIFDKVCYKVRQENYLFCWHIGGKDASFGDKSSVVISVWEIGMIIFLSPAEPGKLDALIESWSSLSHCKWLVLYPIYLLCTLHSEADFACGKDVLEANPRGLACGWMYHCCLHPVAVVQISSQLIWEPFMRPLSSLGKKEPLAGNYSWTWEWQSCLFWGGKPR